MNQNILYNFASRQRPRQFFELLDIIRNLSANKNYSVLAKLDTTDKTNYDEARIEMYYPEVAVIRSNHKSKIQAINNMVTAADIIVTVSDDLVFTANHFDNIIRQYCGPDDFVLFPEPYAESQHAKGKNERIAVMNVTGGRYWARTNYVYHPEYRSFFCDAEETNKARILGRLKIAKEIIFYHKHPTANFKTNDITYMENQRWWGTDKQTYYKRKAINFGLTVPA